MSQDTNVENLIINKLTKAQYEGIASPSPTELYMVTDESGVTAADVVDALGYEPVKPELDNLNEEGSKRLHAVKGYKDSGELLEDAEGLADVIDYAHSSFDSTKFTITGSPVVTDDGIASGFSTSNYLSISNSASLNNSTYFSIHVIFTTPSAWGNQGGRFWAHGANNYIGHTTGGKLSGYFLGQAIDNSGSTVQLQLDTEYEAYYIYDASGWYVKYRKTSETSWTSSTPVAITDTNTVTLTTQTIGKESTGYVFLGSMDLKQFLFVINGLPVFSGNKTGIDTVKPDNYTVIGSPTVTDDGIASGFSNSSTYLLTPTINFGSKFVMELAVNSGDLSNDGDIIGHTTNSDFSIGISLMSTKKFRYSLSSNGTSFNVLYFQTGSFLVTENTNYWVRLEFNGSQYIFSVSTDGRNYVVDKTVSSSEVVVSAPFSLGKTAAAGGTTYSFHGSIDLNSFKIYVDGNLVYQPCLKIPYTESKTGSKVVDSAYRSRVNDMAEQFGQANYYTLNENKANNYIVVGSPTISADGIASGFSSSYITIPTTLDSSSKKVSLEMEITALGIGTTNHPVFLANTLSNHPVKITSSNKLGMYTNAWINGVTSYTTNDVIEVKQEYELTTQKCTLYSRLKGTTNWVQEVQFTSATNPLGNTILIGRNATTANEYYDGSIDLNSFKIYVDGKLAYKAIQPPCFTLPQAEIYGLIGQRTLRDSYRNGIFYYELYSDRTLEQGGSCTSGTDVTFLRPFSDTNYVLSVPYSAKTATGFTPSATGDWIAKGLGNL